MRQLTSIVAMNAAGAIGAGNHLPWRIRSDLQFFRRQTLDQVVIMGRKTYDSLGGALPRRTNIVVTHGFSLFPTTAECSAVGAIDEALVAASRAPKKKEVFIVGGASMYEQFSPYVDRYLITLVDKEVPDADTFFREAWLGDQSDWDSQIISEGIADGKDNEANFRIWEFLPKRPQIIADRRMAAIDALKRRASAGLSFSNFSTAQI
ncbi:dihydrofolate reductase [Sphingomonas sp. HITSZ_GF]|uniref:dihydrofolate reductase n=1 Tax=Sphingomonas sp. HITSZ_GF TaxID=3037247 RepID=UPI00240E7AEB|nr:dihydrofolate reductase [Sphingomonas sp. HITSZ_GF]MDG2533305.1 dihydrofolate reductase [Sphingomonas sp. HITSZ_GF]